MDTLLELFAGGTLREGGSWGGQECLAFVPLQVRNMESAAWVCCLLAALVTLGFRGDVSDLLQRSSLLPFRPTRLDRLLAVVPMGIWLYVLQSKLRIHSLVNLLQPCHLSLLLHALALTKEGPLSTLISIYSLPLVVGAWGALLVPRRDRPDPSRGETLLRAALLPRAVAALPAGPQELHRSPPIEAAPLRQRQPPHRSPPLGGVRGSQRESRRQRQLLPLPHTRNTPPTICASPRRRAERTSIRSGF